MMSSFKALSGARLGELMPTWPCDWIKRTSKGESGSWIANSDGNDSSFLFVSLISSFFSLGYISQDAQLEFGSFWCSTTATQYIN